MGPHSSTLAWKIPWMEEPGRLQSMGLRRVGPDWVTSLSLFTFMHWRRKWQPTPVFLPEESQGRRARRGWGGAHGLLSLGSHRVWHNWSDLAAAAAVHFSSLIHKMSTFTLAISCLTTSNLPWFIDLIFQIPMQDCSLKHQILLPSPVTSTDGCCFSPLISSSILGTYRPGEFIFHCPIFLPFHTVHGVLKARLLKWFGIPFSSGPHFIRILRHEPSNLKALYSMAQSFMEFYNAVVHVIRWVSFLWLWCSFCLPSDGWG